MAARRYACITAMYYHSKGSTTMVFSGMINYDMLDERLKPHKFYMLLAAIQTIRKRSNSVGDEQRANCMQCSPTYSVTQAAKK